MKLEIEKIKKSFIKASKNIINSTPTLIGVMLLMGLITTLINKSTFSHLFNKNIFFNTITGSILGSILAGNPITSYVIGGELLTNNVSLLAITAFLVAWTTVGLVQLPAESIILGKRFAITRNITAFVFSIIVAIITVLVVNLI